MSNTKNTVPLPLPLPKDSNIEEEFHITPLSSSSITVDYINPVEGEDFQIPNTAPTGVDMGRGGTRIYKDKLFEAVLDTMNTNPIATIRGIKCKQINEGSKLVFYQGNPSNYWGYIDVLKLEKTEKGYRPLYNVKIYNSFLKSILKEDERTKKFFESIQ